MMLSNLPASRKDSSHGLPRDDAPLHERLFGERSTAFYVGIGLWLTMLTGLLIVAAIYAPRSVPTVLGALGLPVFYLLEGSPSRRLQAVAVGILGGAIWSAFDLGLLGVAAAAVVTGFVAYRSEVIVRRELAAVESMTRRQRQPNVLRMVAASGFATALVTVPSAVAAYGMLLDRGWDTQMAAAIAVGGVGLFGYAAYRQIVDELPVPVGG